MNNLDNIRKEYRKRIDDRLAYINYKLKLAGSSQTQIAEELGITIGAVNQVLLELSRSSGLEKRVHDAIEKTIGEKIF